MKGNNGEGTKGHQEREKGRERDHRRRKWGGGGGGEGAWVSSLFWRGGLSTAGASHFSCFSMSL